jgi:hypothetical protein
VERTMLEQLGACPAGQEGRDQHVRVEEDSHEMR